MRRSFGGQLRQSKRSLQQFLTMSQHIIVEAAGLIRCPARMQLSSGHFFIGLSLGRTRQIHTLAGSSSDSHA
jgi:hypothetical protein